MSSKSRILLLPLAAGLFLLSLMPVKALDRQTRLQVMSAVVQISLVRVQGVQVYFLPWGSGTIVSADGLILTNCHVADPRRFGLPAEQVPDYDYLGIGLTVRSDRPPQLTYLGKVAQADPYLDLAVVRITHKTDLKPVKAGELNLPFVELGDSDQVEVGDDLNIFGYPGIGGETVTFTRGVVSGFTLDAAIEGRAWLKTDASISGGNSGGTAVDEEGLLVGVPTRAGVGGGTEPVDCRPVKDTNGDGRIDASDDCVPVGGFINAMRPINLAKPLIEAARRGLPDAGRQNPREEPAPTSGAVRISDLFFSAGVNEFDQPTRIVTSLPSGARSLYLFFDYDNMGPSNTFEMKVLIDGQEQVDWGMPPGPWQGDEQGMWWIGWSDVRFTDGLYDLVLYVDGDEKARAQIGIGGTPQSQPAFYNILFSVEAAASGEPKQPTVYVQAGIQQVMAFFEFEGMSSGTRWTHVWLMDGEEIARKDEIWRAERSGRTSLTLTNPEGFAPGAYRLKLLIGGRLAALSNFWVLERSDEGASFAPVTFATGIDAKGKPVGAADRFPSGLEELHVFSTYSGMQDGLDFAVRWYIDDQVVLESENAWDGGESGEWHYYLYSESGALPDGTYRLELGVAGRIVQQATAQIGTGPRPTPEPQPSRAGGIQVQGYILDMDTQRPIPGALFLVLQPGITLNTFQWTDDELFTMAEADRRGFYKLPQLLERGECYTVIVGAEGYWPYGEDDVCFAAGDPSLLELPVLLERR